MSGTRGTGSSIVLVLFVWLLVIGVLIFQYWFLVHHPILTLFLGIFEVLLDLVLFLVAIGVTVFVVWRGTVGSSSGPQLGARQGRRGS